MKPFFRLLIILGTLLSLPYSVAQTATQPAVLPITNAAPTPTTSPGPKVWNLQDADIISVINEISQETGKNFVIDPRVQGKITLISSKAIKPENAYDVFLSILELLGYSAIPSGNVVKIVPNLESSEMATRVATAGSPGRGDEVVVRVIALEHVSANQLIPILRPLLPQWSNVSAYPPGNVLILVGRASNIQRLSDIIRNVDTASNNDIDIVPLRQASATQIANVLNNLQNASRASGEMPTIFVTADERSNSILLSGNKSARLRTRVIISQLDTPTSGVQDNTEVVYLRYLQAKNLAPILGKIADNILGKGTEPKDTGYQISSTTSNAPARDEISSGKVTQTKVKTTPENLTNIQAEPNTNALIITAPPSLMRALNSVIAKLDVRPAQVLVEAIIVEVNQNDLRNLGIQWGSVSPTGSVNAPDIAATSPTASAIDFPPFGANVVGIIPHQQIKAILNILENKTGVDILSTPSLVVLDNHKAILEVGQDIPEQTGSYATTGSTSTVTPFNTIGRKQVTLKLNVIPQINLGCSVRLNIELDNDSLQDPQSNTLNPKINTSKIKNSVIINSGDILVLGGLIRNNMVESLIKVPILGDIPIIGNAFRNTDRTLEKKNLMMFIKPVILHTEEDSIAVTNTKYDAARNVQINFPEKLTPGSLKQSSILPPRNYVELPPPFQE